MKLIKEFTEFGHMRLGSGDSIPQSTHVDNPELSLGASNRFQSNLQQSLSRLNSLFQNIMLSTTGVNIRTGDTVDASDIKNIKILRIFPKDDIYLNIYFTFKLEEEEYYGVIKKINSYYSSVESEIFHDDKLATSREWEIRIKGNLVKAIKKWLNIAPGNFKLLKDIDAINEKSGEMTLIPIDSTVKVTRTLNDEIYISFQDEIYVLRGRNFYYFNYYFQEIQSE